MNPVTGLALGRIAVGVAALAKPDLLTSGMGQQPGSPLLAQAFGSREIAIGVLTLASRGAARRNLTLVGMGIDGADAATAYLGVRSGTVPKTLGLGLAGLAVGGVVSGLVGLRKG